MDPLTNFFDQRVFGASRKIMLSAATRHASAPEAGLDQQKAALAAEIRELQEAKRG